MTYTFAQVLSAEIEDLPLLLGLYIDKVYDRLWLYTWQQVGVPGQVSLSPVRWELYNTCQLWPTLSPYCLPCHINLGDV